MDELDAAEPLQWGRDVSVAEMAHAIAHLGKRVELQWGRDVSAAEMQDQDPHLLGEIRFNGAATFPSRKFDFVTTSPVAIN